MEPIQNILNGMLETGNTGQVTTRTGRTFAGRIIQADEHSVVVMMDCRHGKPVRPEGGVCQDEYHRATIRTEAIDVYEAH